MKRMSLYYYLRLYDNADERTRDCLFSDRYLNKCFSVSMETLFFGDNLLYYVIIIDDNGYDKVYEYEHYKSALRCFNNIRKKYLNEVLKNGSKN